MNDYEMMNQRVDQLRKKLGRLNHKQTVLDSLKADVMEELLDTRRQITKMDKLKVKMGYFIEGKSSSFKEEARDKMDQLSLSISDIEWAEGPTYQSVSWKGIPRFTAPVDYLDV